MYNAPRYQQHMYNASDNHPVNQQILELISNGLLGGPSSNMSTQQRQTMQTIITAMNPMISQVMGTPDASHGWSTLYRGLAANPATINVAGPGGGSYASFNRAQVHAAAASQISSELQQQIYTAKGNTNPYSGLSEQTVMGMAADYAKRNPVVMHQEQMASSGAALDKQLDKLVSTGKLKAGSREEKAYRRQAIAMDTMQIASIMEAERQATGKVISVKEAEKLMKSEKYAGKDVFSTLDDKAKQAVRMGVREVSSLKNRGLMEGEAALSDSEFASSEIAMSGRGNVSIVDGAYTDAMKKAMKQQSKVVAELSEVFGTKDYTQITQNAKALHMKSLSTEQGLKEAKERIHQSVALASVTNRSVADILQEQADIGQQLGRHASGASIMMIQRRAAAFASMDERAGGQGMFNLAEMTAQSIQARTNNQNNAMGYSFAGYMMEKLSLDDSTRNRVDALRKTMQNPENREAYQAANNELLAIAARQGVDIQNEALKQYVSGHYSADSISTGKASVYMKDTLGTLFELSANSIGGATGEDILQKKDAYTDQATELYQLYGRDTDKMQAAIAAAGGDKSIEDLKREGFIDSEISMISKLRQSGLNMNTLNHLVETTKTNDSVIANADQMMDGKNYIGNKLLENAAKEVGSNKFWDRMNGRKFDIVSGGQAFLKGVLGMEELSGDEALSANLSVMANKLENVDPKDFNATLRAAVGEKVKSSAIAEFMSNSENAAAVEKELAKRGIHKNDINYAEKREEAILDVAKARRYDEQKLLRMGGTMSSDLVLTAKKNENGQYEYSDEFLDAVIARSGTNFTKEELRADPAAMEAAMNNMQDMAITEQNGHLVMMHKNINDLMTTGNMLNHEKLKGIPAEIANNLITNEDGSIAGFVNSKGEHIKANGRPSFTVGEDDRYVVKLDEHGNFEGYEDTKVTTEFNDKEQTQRDAIQANGDLNDAEKMSALSADETAKHTAALCQIFADLMTGSSSLSVKVAQA